MKAHETNLLTFLKGPKQFSVPLYQRTYSWTRKQCEQLWNDIIRIEQDQSIPAHFIGSVVYIAGGVYQATSVPQLLVIDGQQRLTTLSLLLSALGKAIEQSKNDLDINGETITRRKINNYYLFNSEEDGNRRYKLMLTQGDQHTYFRLVDGKELPSGFSQRLTENYQFFEDQIRKSGVALERLFNGIGKLIMIDVSLEQGLDNPQLIFESLNSTGLDLSQADLIRNYILMGLEARLQTQLYSDYWYPMEQNFGQAEYAVQFDRFMRDYLTVKNAGTIPNIREVYADFKTFAAKQRALGSTVHTVVDDIYRYSKYFVAIAFLQENDDNIRDALNDLRDLKVEVANPFLMEVYDDYQQGSLTHDDFLAIIRLIESYVFRRAIVGIPTNSLNKTFATLAREIDKTAYLRSIELIFWAKDSYKRFPRDEEFAQQFILKDVYNFPRRSYMLRKLENYRRKERVNVDGCTIEHILPQNPNLSEEWQADLGPDWQQVQARFLHTIGNLTLTGYNSELSDHSFHEKQTMEGGFSHSPFYLNDTLRTLELWDEGALLNRANELARRAIEVWAAPAVSADDLSAYLKPTAAETNTIEEMQGGHHLRSTRIAELFEALRIRILNLDSSVREEVKKYYIAYKTATNFVDIVPQASRLHLSLNMQYDQIVDPKGMCRDVSNMSRWGNGDVEVGLASLDELDYVMFLVRQAFETQSDVQD